MIESYRRSIAGKIAKFTLIQKFNLTSLIILVVCFAIIGYWVSNQIKSRVVSRVGHTTALFAGSIIAPAVVNLLRNQDPLQPALPDLDAILNATSLGEDIVALKLWDKDGRVIYSTVDADIGRIFPIEAGLKKAWDGMVSAEISALDREEHGWLSRSASNLLETYSPIREPGTGLIVAVVEFYQSVEGIENEIRNSRAQSWGVAAIVVVIIYLSLISLVRSGSNKINSQKDELQQTVVEYRRLLDHNAVLHNRVRSAALRTTTLNEKFLKKIAADLHDGPSQDIGYALLTSTDKRKVLQHALDEIRAISAGLRSPELESLSITEVINLAIRKHKTRSSVQVDAEIENLPQEVSLAVKIAVFRVLQEALTNAYKHSADASPSVKAVGSHSEIHIVVTNKISDQRNVTENDTGTHLGISIMKERVELLGGGFFSGQWTKTRIP